MGTPPPRSLGDRFEIGEALGETPFERCFRAHDRLLQRDVLLKLPAAGAFDGWSAPIRERLLREARALAKIRHENVAPIHWVDETAEGPLLVFDLPEGELLAERLQRGPLDADETLALGMQIGTALAHVHLHGVVHRAVGPSSIRLLANGRAQLGAFTFAKEFGVRGQGSSLSHARRDDADVGRHLPDYSAPEQAAGQAADPRADVYALGCTLFRCLAGHDPFPAGQQHEPMPDLRKLRQDVDRRLAEVIRKCTLHAKAARFATAQEVVDALQAAKVGGQQAPPRRRLAAVAAAVAGVGIAAWIAADSLVGSDGGSPRGGEPVVSAEDGRYHETYGPDYERTHGLFIAIGQGYDGVHWRKLVNPVREVEEVAAQLRANDPEAWDRPGAITVLLDGAATWKAVKDQFDRIEREARKEDAVLVYFSGHGENRGESFGLCLQDVTGTIENGTGYIDREMLKSFVRKCKAKHVLVVLDCCHSAAVFETGTIGAPKGGGERRVQPGEHHRMRFSREFLCSAAANEEASDGHGLSPFCKLLLARLREPSTPERRYVAACFLAPHIQEAMDHNFRMGSLQVPKFRQMSAQEGSFVFLLAPAK